MLWCGLTMSPSRCERRVCGRGQTTSKPSIHRAPSYGLRNCFGKLHWELREPSKSHTNALTQPVKSHFTPRLVIKKGLELMASTLGSTFQKDEVGVWTRPPWHHLLCKSFENSFKIREWMKVEISSNVKYFELYPRGRKAKNWGNIGVVRYVRSQSTVKIFLAPDHTGGVHNASSTRMN